MRGAARRAYRCPHRGGGVKMIGLRVPGDAGGFRRSVSSFVASIPITIIFIAVLGIVLTAAGPDGLDLTDAQTSGWIAVLYGLPTLIALFLSVRYRQPLLMTGNVFAIIFFVSIGDRVTFPELAGASMVAGAIVRRRCSGSPVGLSRGSRPRSSTV